MSLPSRLESLEPPAAFGAARPGPPKQSSRYWAWGCPEWLTRGKEWNIIGDNARNQISVMRGTKLDIGKRVLALHPYLTFLHFVEITLMSEALECNGCRCSCTP